MREAMLTKQFHKSIYILISIYRFNFMFQFVFNFMFIMVSYSDSNRFPTIFSALLKVFFCVNRLHKHVHNRFEQFTLSLMFSKFVRISRLLPTPNLFVFDVTMLCATLCIAYMHIYVKIHFSVPCCKYTRDGLAGVLTFYVLF